MARRALAVLVAALVLSVSPLAPRPAPAHAAGSPLDHVVVVVMENHSYGEIVGSPSAPYLNSLIAGGGLATNYFAVAHPSLPNYIALTAGSTYGITTDCTSCYLGVANLADRLESAGRTWRAYFDGMPSPCYAGSSYPYAQKHNPFAYYDDIRLNGARCAAHLVPYSQLNGDFASAATTPAFSWISPDLCHDMHDCSIATGDAWLSSQLPAILASPAFSAGRSALFVVWDEDDFTTVNQVALIAAGPAVRPGYRSGNRYDHYSLLHTVEWALGAGTLTAADAAAPVMTDLFASVPAAPTAVSAAPGDTYAALTWSAPADGGAPITGYRITASNGATTLTGSSATTGTIGGLVDGASYTFTVAAINGAGEGPPSAASNAVTPQPTAPGAYVGLAPFRILDTRPATHVGAYSTPFGSGVARPIAVAGIGGIPTSGVSAVVLNVTVTNPTLPGYLTAYPHGVARPTASNLNFRAGQTVANLVQVAVGAFGAVDIFNFTGSADVVVDVAGYFAPAGAGLYNPTAPTRLMDTRDSGGYTAIGPRSGALGSGTPQPLTIAGMAPVPAGATAVVLNLAVTDATANSFLTLYPAGGALPLASNINFVAGDTVANRVVVQLGVGGAIDIYNFAGSVDVVIDVNGYFAGGGDRYFPLPPARIIDTRSTAGYTPVGPYTAPLGPQAAYAVAVAGHGGVPSVGASAVVADVAVTDTTEASYLTLWATDAERPTASDLDWAAADTVPNLTVTKLSAAGSMSIFNYAGAADLVVDVGGYYAP